MHAVLNLLVSLSAVVIFILAAIVSRPSMHVEEESFAGVESGVPCVIEVYPTSPSAFYKKRISSMMHEEEEGNGLDELLRFHHRPLRSNATGEEDATFVWRCVHCDEEDDESESRHSSSSSLFPPPCLVNREDRGKPANRGAEAEAIVRIVAPKYSSSVADLLGTIVGLLSSKRFVSENTIIELQFPSSSDLDSFVVESNFLQCEAAASAHPSLEVLPTQSPLYLSQWLLAGFAKFSLVCTTTTTDRIYRMPSFFSPKHAFFPIGFHWPRHHDDDRQIPFPVSIASREVGVSAWWAEVEIVAPGCTLSVTGAEFSAALEVKTDCIGATTNRTFSLPTSLFPSAATFPLGLPRTNGGVTTFLFFGELNDYSLDALSPWCEGFSPSVAERDFSHAASNIHRCAQRLTSFAAFVVRDVVPRTLKYERATRDFALLCLVRSFSGAISLFVQALDEAAESMRGSFRYLSALLLFVQALDEAD